MSDYTNIIQEINTNIPDNTDQSITALKVRTTLIDMLDAVDDNMTEAIGEISVPTKTSDLTNDSGFITATSLEPYVTHAELNSASYVTSSQLNNASYATQSFVDDAIADAITDIDVPAYTSDLTNDSGFITVTDVNNLLSTASYVTSAQLSAIGYITNQDLEQTLSSATYVTESQLQQAGYVSQSDISNMGYVTGSEIAASGYVTQNALNNMSYVSQNDLQSQLADYVTQSQLNNASYVNATQLNEAISGITVPTKTSDLTNDSGFITSSDLSGYATETYVADYVATHSGPIDLSSYVTKDELSQASYVTQSQLSSMTYATETYVADYVATHSGPIDLSSYVTKDELNNASYATTTQLNDAISGITVPTKTSDLTNDSGFITSIPAEYITQTELESQLVDYVTESEIAGMGYVTATALSNMGYITTNELPDMSSYATLTYLESYYATLQEVWDGTDAMQQIFIDANILVGDPETGDWVVQTMASETYVADYVAQHAPTPDLTAYVKKSELIQAGYVTGSEISQMGYVTSSALSNMSYATTSELNSAISGIVIPTKTSDLTNDSGFITSSALSGLATETYVTNAIADIDMPVMDENIIPKENDTYNLGDSNYRYNNIYSKKYYLNNSLMTYDGNSIVFSINNNYKYVFNSNDIYPYGSQNNKALNLGKSDRMWLATYSQYFFEDGTDIKDIYTQTEVVTQAEYDALTTEEKNSETIYVISDQQAYFDNELVTEQSLAAKGFLTADNFQYDPVTGVLTLIL